MRKEANICFLSRANAMRKTHKRGGSRVDKVRLLQDEEMRRNKYEKLHGEIDALKDEVNRLKTLSETHDKLILML